MGGLKIAVRFVLGMAQAVIVERIGFGRAVTPRARISIAEIGDLVVALLVGLVDVVAIVEHEVHRLFGDPPPRGVIAVFVMLAPGDREPQAVEPGMGQRQCAAAPDGARFAPTWKR
jgi:hypothetical protein